MGFLQRTILLLMVACGGAGCQAESRVELIAPGTPSDPVSVTGLSEKEAAGVARFEDNWTSVFGVYIASEDRVPAVLGDWELTGSTLEFHPRFPFVPGQEYRASFVLGETRREIRFVLEASPAPVEVSVVRVYPTRDFVPENLLRVYIYFSASMQGGDVYRNIHLENAAGERVEQAFVETTPELWTPEMRRVTMIFHPGRIKQGLEMSDRDGPPLRQGEDYRLVVDAGMRAVNGAVLEERYEKHISVGRADRTSPDPGRWKIEPSFAGTRDPVRIHLDEPLDHALLPRFLSVENEHGSTIAGTLTVLRGEKLCFYVPGQDWLLGDYHLVVQSALEDLAGNRVDMLFDRESTPTPSERKAIRLPFTIGEPEPDQGHEGHE